MVRTYMNGHFQTKDFNNFVVLTYLSIPEPRHVVTLKTMGISHRYTNRLMNV